MTTDTYNLKADNKDVSQEKSTFIKKVNVKEHGTGAHAQSGYRVMCAEAMALISRHFNSYVYRRHAMDRDGYCALCFLN